jgi:pimeloyl-ACP methyl ester carboxylesterase
MLITNYRSDFVNVNGLRLHYLDWGGDGPALVFLAGMGCSAYFYAEFAPRFTDQFRVLALTRRGHGDSDYPEIGYNVDILTEDLRQFLDTLGLEQVILAGHSMANIELCHFAALYPQRVLKLVFLDAAYDRTQFQPIMEKNPLNAVQPPNARTEFDSVEEMMAYTRRIRPDLAAIWGDVLEQDFKHSVTQTADGKFVDKMSDELHQTLLNDVKGYVPEDSKIRAPVLSIYALWNNYDYFLPDYLTDEQRAAMIEFVQTVQLPIQRACIEQFRRDVPHARIVEIPQGHHYCFIKEADLVYAEMRRFLQE